MTTAPPQPAQLRQRPRLRLLRRLWCPTRPTPCGPCSCGRVRDVAGASPLTSRTIATSPHTLASVARHAPWRAGRLRTPPHRARRRTVRAAAPCLPASLARHFTVLACLPHTPPHRACRLPSHAASPCTLAALARPRTPAPLARRPPALTPHTPPHRARWPPLHATSHGTLAALARGRNVHATALERRLNLHATALARHVPSHACHVPSHSGRQRSPLHGARWPPSLTPRTLPCPSLNSRALAPLAHP
jgi:hypothetical protein